MAGGIDEYLIRTPNELLLYDKAIKIKKNLLRGHRRRLEASRLEAQMTPAEPPAAS